MPIGRLVQWIGLCCALATVPAPVVAGDEVYVSNYYCGLIHVYPRTTNADVPPTRTIQTGLSLPHDNVVDLLHRELFVPNNQPAG